MTGYDFSGLRVLVMTETEFIADEMDYYKTHFERNCSSPRLAGQMWC